MELKMGRGGQHCSQCIEAVKGKLIFRVGTRTTNSWGSSNIINICAECVDKMKEELEDARRDIESSNNPG